jgi:hypothetical protein
MTETMFGYVDVGVFKILFVGQTLGERHIIQLTRGGIFILLTVVQLHLIGRVLESVGSLNLRILVGPPPPL